MKFGFYVSNMATRLIKAINFMMNAGELHPLLDSISFVFRDNQRNDPLVDICTKNGIEIIQLDLSTTTANNRSQTLSDSLFHAMGRTKIDYLFVFGSRLLKGQILSEYKGRIINFHPSLLPAFPGMKSIDQAIAYGSFVAGNTAHFIDAGIDTGQIIMQNICVVDGFKEYDEILDKQVPMLIQIMKWLEDERVMIDGRIVKVKDAEYCLSQFIPNLELKPLIRAEENV